MKEATTKYSTLSGNRRKTLLNLFAGRRMFFLIEAHMCIYHPGADRGSGKLSLLYGEGLSSNFIGVAHPSPASSPVILLMYIVYKYCSVCICTYIHKAKVYINQDKLWLPGL